MFKIGIIGMGRVYDYQIEAVKEIRDIQVSAVCDTDEGKIVKKPEKARFYKNFHKMIKEEKLDAVVISLPNILHYEVAKVCLEEGLNVLIEKPAVLDIQEFKNLVKLSREKGAVFVVSLHYYFAKEVQWFKRKYDEELRKQLGEITYFRSGFFDSYIENGKLKSFAKSLNGSWIDSGINALSVIGKFIKDLEVSESRLIFIDEINRYGDIQGTVFFEFGFNNYGLIETGWVYSIDCKISRFRFENPKKEIILNHSKQQVILKESEESQIIADFSKTGNRLVNHYKGVFLDFIKHLEKGTDNIDFAYYIHSLLFDAVNKNGKIKECF